MFAVINTKKKLSHIELFGSFFMSISHNETKTFKILKIRACIFSIISGIAFALILARRREENIK